MYVIFPLEDLLDPSGGLSRRTTVKFDNPPPGGQPIESTDASLSPSTLPNQTIPPDQPASTDQTVSRSSTPSSITITGNISRSGSIRAQSSCSTSALASQISQSKINLSVQKLSAIEKIENLVTTKKVVPQSKVTPIDVKSRPGNDIQQLSQSTEQKTSNTTGSTKFSQTNAQQQQNKPNIIIQSNERNQAAPSKQVQSQVINLSQASIVVTPPATNPLLRDKARDKPSETNRNSWPSNAESQLSPNTSNIVRSSSCRSKEPLRPSVPLVSGLYIGEVFSANKRKTVSVTPSGLPKESETKQKSPFGGAKDCRISAKEFNYNVSSGSDVTIKNKDSNLQIISPLGGSNDRPGELVREGSFRNRKVVPQVLIPSVARLSFGSSDEVKLEVDSKSISGRSYSFRGISTPSESRRSSVKQKVPSTGRQESLKPSMAFAIGDQGLRQLSHPALNEPLKAHNNVTFKLLKTGKNNLEYASTNFTA